MALYRVIMLGGAIWSSKYLIQGIYYSLQHWIAKSVERGMALCILNSHKYTWFAPIMVIVCCYHY